MPALDSDSGNANKTFVHISNKGVENINLFGDQQDFETFLNFLGEYLSPPPDASQLKKTFSVNGRTFKGVPHQPKNYYNKIELLAYSLLPNHFHLIVRQIGKDPIEKLIRSLSTRYAIYFNKKYSRKGSLFSGPYKSSETEDLTQLTFLTHYLYRETEDMRGYSSYSVYTGEKTNPWVNPQAVLSFLDNYEQGEFRGPKGYKKFVEKYDLSDSEQKAIEHVVIDKIAAQEKQKETLVPQPTVTETPTTAPTPEPAPAVAPVQRPRQKVPEFIGISTMVFIMLFAVGYRNVTRSAQEEKTIQLASQPTPSPQVAGSETEESSKTLITPTDLASTATPTPHVSESEEMVDENTSPITSDENNPITYVFIKIDDGSASVNIRKEPTTSSEIVGSALDGDKYEYVSKAGNWYEIKLDSDEVAYIHANYVQEEREN
jgi:REP element-mobilizing transposase RayT